MVRGAAITAASGACDGAHGRRRRGVTLIELLVVVAVVGLLVGLLIPAVQAVREVARRMACGDHLRQMGLAVTAHETARRTFPTGRTGRGTVGVSWAFTILPYLEEEGIFQSYVTGLPAYDDRNARAMRTAVATLFCPSHRPPTSDRDFDNDGNPPVVRGAAAAGDFAAVAGTPLTYGSDGGGIDPRRAGPIHTFSRVRAAQVTDGLGRTCAVGEKHIPPVDPAWPSEIVHRAQGDTAIFAADTPTTLFRAPTRGLCGSISDPWDDTFGSRHPGLTGFVFLDGHVESLANDISPEVLRRCCAIGDGGESAAGSPAAGDDGS